MFKPINLIVFLQISTHFNFDACNTFQKTGKVEKCSKSTCLEHCAGEQVNWKQTSAMFVYKSSIPERLSCTQARMGQGLPLCETNDCVKDITTCAQKHCLETVSLQVIALGHLCVFGIGDAHLQIKSLLEIGKNDIYIFLITSALDKV